MTSFLDQRHLPTLMNLPIGRQGQHLTFAFSAERQVSVWDSEGNRLGTYSASTLAKGLYGSADYVARDLNICTDPRSDGHVILTFGRPGERVRKQLLGQDVFRADAADTDALARQIDPEVAASPA